MIPFHRTVKMIFFIGFVLLMSNCGGSAPQSKNVENKNKAGLESVDINLLAAGTEIRHSGQQLMDYPLGVIELKSYDQSNDSVLVMAVHGYESQGYEWITGLKNVAEYYGSIFFYRYDWKKCPDVIAHDLAEQIKTIYKMSSYRKIVIFGHSYGGMVVTFAAAELGKMNADIHVIAAPLSGFPNLLDECGNLTYGENDKLIYPEWSKSIRVIQHKTVHAQDGAFRELASDPQDIDLPFYSVIEMPPTMDGHRLGHNWSVTWVLDKHIGKPHRY